MVVVGQDDVEGAFRRARFKDTVRKIKERTKNAFGMINRLRSRSTSSVNVLNAPHLSAEADQQQTPRAESSSSTTGGFNTPVRPALGGKKGYRQSYSPGTALSVQSQQAQSSRKGTSTKGKSREASPGRSPLGRWGPFSNRAESMETPRSGSPVATSSASITGTLEPGEETDVPRTRSRDRDANAGETVRAPMTTPKARRSSTNALLSPPPSGHVRRTSSLSVTTKDNAEILAAELRKVEDAAKPPATPTATPGSESGEKPKKLAWLTRFGSKSKRKNPPPAAPLTAITTPTNPVGTIKDRPRTGRSVTTFEAQSGSEKGEGSLRYRQSHEAFTDDSSLGARSYTSLSPVMNRDMQLHGAPRLRRGGSTQQYHYQSQRSPYQDTDDDQDDGNVSTGTGAYSFNFSDDSDADEDYDGTSADLMIGAGGFPAVHNRGFGWEVYPTREPTSQPSSSGASSPQHSPLGSTHHSSAAMSSTRSYPSSSPTQRPMNLNLDALSAVINSAPFHQPSPSPLAYQSFHGHDRHSFSEDIEEHDGEDEEDDDDDDEGDFLEVRTRQHGSPQSSARARSQESDTRVRQQPAMSRSR